MNSSDVILSKLFYYSKENKTVLSKFEVIKFYYINQLILQNYWDIFKLLNFYNVTAQNILKTKFLQIRFNLFYTETLLESLGLILLKLIKINNLYFLLR